MAENQSFQLFQLFEQLGGDSEEAFALLIHCFKQPLQTRLRIYLQETDLVEETFRETCTEIWKSRKKLGAMEYPVTWIFRTAQNKAFRKIQFRKRRKIAQQAYQAILERQDNLELDLVVRELEQQVLRNLKELSTLQQQVFQLNKLDGWTYIQVAEFLGSPVETVRDQLGAAAKRMRQLIIRLNP